MRHVAVLITAALLVGPYLTRPIEAQDRKTRVLQDRESFLAGRRWIYNDLPRGFEEARKTGKPLLVVLRCIPCEACRGFDEQVASFDLRIRKLLDRFVRVRIPQANGLDLSLFQFDYDLSFYAFFLGADRTIYGRFGSRSTQKDKTGEVSIDAFREAMLEALRLHGRRAEFRDALRAKTGAEPSIRYPELYPSLKGRYESTIDYGGKVVQSCIHCHQIRDAERKMFRTAGKPIPDRVLYPWPLPDVFGLRLDPRKRATVLSIDDDSPAARAGFRDGDELLSLEGQPLVSIADVQWILHHAAEEGTLAARVRREGEELKLELPLDRDWRRRSDLSWRVTTWELRRMGAGGLVLEDVPAEERRRLGLPPDTLALRAGHVGQYGDHARAKRAGFKKGDIIVAVDGRTDPMRETEFLAYTVQKKSPGDRLELTVVRDGERKSFSFEVK